MEIIDTRNALAAKSHKTTLEELKREGKDEVKVIKASDVASMIHETVCSVLKDTEMLSEEELQVLVDQGQVQFKYLVHERQRERNKLEDQLSQVRAELDRAMSRVQELEGLLAAKPAGPDAATSEVMQKLVQEMAAMKGGGGGDGAGGGGVDAMTSALDKLSTTMNERLEKFGRKMGVSSATEAQDIDFGALYNRDDEVAMESNMDNVEAKKKTGGGIADNLAKLKKLKGQD